MLGTAMGWSSPAQPQLQLNTSFNYENGQQEQQSQWDMTLDNHQMSWVASLVNLGALFGSLMGGALMNLVGRKGILMMTTLPVGLGWIIVTLAINPGIYLS
jgi:MFS family permease